MEEAAAFMAGEAAASMVEGASAAEVVCAPAAGAGSAADRQRRPLPAIEDRVPHRAQGASSHRGPATTILDPAEISRAEISGLEIPLRLPLLPPTVGGIPLEAQLAAADLRADKCKPGPPVTQEASTSLAGIADRDLVQQFGTFRVRVAKFGRMLPPREMLFPGLYRFPLFTIRSAVPPPRVPVSVRTRRSPRLRALPADRHSWAIEDFQVV
jgi:hypothetical protein